MSWTYQFAYKCTICGSNCAVINQMNEETTETRDICESCADEEEANERYGEEEE